MAGCRNTLSSWRGSECIVVAVADETSRRGEFAPDVDRRHRVAGRQSSQLFVPAGEEWFAGDHESAGARLTQRREDAVEVALAAGVEDLELQPEGKGRRPRFARLAFGNRRHGGIDEEGHETGRRQQLMENFETLRRQPQGQLGDTRDVAARPA